MSSEATQNQNPPSRKTAVSILAVLIAITIALFWGETANLFGLRPFFSRPAAISPSIVDTAPGSTMASKTPIYFLSHGGVSTNSLQYNFKLLN